MDDKNINHEEFIEDVHEDVVEEVIEEVHEEAAPVKGGENWVRGPGGRWILA